MENNIRLVRDKLDRSLKRAGRDANNCTVLAVSKTKPVALIDAARAAGVSQFAENRVQEAAEKFPARNQRENPEKLHLIGPLQSNKARLAFDYFDAIHSLDRPKLATTFARLADEVGYCPELLIQVNTGAEPQKAGVLPDDLDELVEHTRNLGLPLVGLMCIPPADEAPAPHFAWLARRASELSLRELSMGMSGDFEAAAELGATYVRVGSALFGER